MRKIHIDDKIYEYKVGSRGIQLTCPDGKKKRILTIDIFGCTPDDLERVDYKNAGSAKWSDITPGILKQYIIEKGI